MKSLYKIWMLMVIVTMGVVSCQEADVDTSVADMEVSEGILYASIENPSTRVAFEEDSDTKSIKVEWELGDRFTLYNATTGYRYSDYICQDPDEERFEKENSQLLLYADYVAVYPACDFTTLEEARSRDLTSVQSVSDINDLDAACVMEAEFSYISATLTSLTFKYQKAIMSFNLSVPLSATEVTLLFENGDESYEVDIEVEPLFSWGATTKADFEDTFVDSRDYTAHIMINPCEEGERILRFKLYDADGELLEECATTTSKAYLAGYRYIATLSNYNLGTSDSPYLINTAEDMWNFAAAVSADNEFKGAYFLLTQDIDLGCTEDNQWVPIDSFKGYFDGGGHVISGLYINNEDVFYQALFYYNSGVIANLGVDDSSVSCRTLAATFAYYNNGTIVNCWSGAAISCIDGSGSAFASYNFGTINNCYFVGTADYGAVFMNYIILKNCYALDGSCRTLVYGGEGSQENVVTKSSSEMTSESFVDMLNNGAANYNSGDVVLKACAWSFNEGGYPQLDGEGEPTVLMSGEGTAESPYLIGSAEGLVYLSDLAQTETFEGKYIKQTADITLTEEWTPIGIPSCYFGGNYDGGSYKISGLTINSSSGYQGLFGVVSGTAVISNVGVLSGQITSNQGCIGAIVGENLGTVYSCYNAANITGGDIVGGIVGQNFGTIEACYNKGSVHTIGTYAGGIVGKNYGGRVNSVYSMGEITGNGAYGVAGVNVGGAITACYSTMSALYCEPSGDYVNVAASSSYNTLAEFNSLAFCTMLNSALTTNAWVYSLLYGEYPQLIYNIEEEAEGVVVVIP